MITKLVRLFPIHLVKIKTHLKGSRQGHPLKGSAFCSFTSGPIPEFGSYFSVTG